MAPTVQTRTKARRMLAAAHKAGLIPHGPAFPHFQYRRAGQRGSSSVAVFDAGRHADPKASLEALLGTVSEFEPVRPRFPARLTLPGGAPPSPSTSAPRRGPAPRLPLSMPLQIRVPMRDPTPRPLPRVEPPAPRNRAPMPDPETPAGRLDLLARQVWQLSPSHRDPEAFHVAKSVIAAELRTIGSSA